MSVPKGHTASFHEISPRVLALYKRKDESRARKILNGLCPWCGMTWELYDEPDGHFDVDGFRELTLNIEGHMQAHNFMLLKLEMDERAQPKISEAS